MKSKLINLFGWYGVIAILLAFALLNFSIIMSSSYLYLALNLTGAISIMFEALKKKDFQPAVLNIAWAIIALIGIIKIFIK